MDDCCLIPTKQFSATSWQEQVAFQWDNDCFVLQVVGFL
jgi:hypothetical protein